METSSADSVAASSVMLGDLLSVPLKQPYSVSLTSDFLLLGQPRLFSSDDNNLSPALEYEAPYFAAKPSCPSSLASLTSLLMTSDSLCPELMSIFRGLRTSHPSQELSIGGGMLAKKWALHLVLLLVHSPFLLLDVNCPQPLTHESTPLVL